MTALQRSIEVSIPDEVLNRLNNTERRIAMYAVNGEDNPKIIDMNSSQVKSLIDNILLKVAVKLGYTERTKDDNKQLMPVLNDDLFKHCKGLTAKEVYAALDCGLDGEFLTDNETKVFFNLSTFVIWVKRWIVEHKQPIMAKVHDFSHSLPDERPVSTERDMLISKYQLYVREIINAHEGGREFMDIGEFLYSFLVKFELIEPVTKEFIEFVAINELQLSKIDRDKSRTRQVSDVLETLKVASDIEGNVIYPIAARKAVVAQLKKIAAYEEDDIMDYLENVKVDLQEYFKEHNL